MWNTGYPGTQKLGLSAQSHSCSRTHTSWTWCAPLELCYSDGGQGSCKFLRLTCPFHTLTHIQRAGGPCILLLSFLLECGLNLEINEWVTGNLKEKSMSKDLPILGSFSAFCSDSFPHPWNAKTWKAWCTFLPRLWDWLVVISWHSGWISRHGGILVRLGWSMDSDWKGCEYLGSP